MRGENFSIKAFLPAPSFKSYSKTEGLLLQNGKNALIFCILGHIKKTKISFFPFCGEDFLFFSGFRFLGIKSFEFCPLTAIN